MDKFKLDTHKLHYHPERIAQWYTANTLEDKLEVYPLYVEISPVGQCNHRCSFCAVDYLKYENKSIDKNILAAAVEEMSYYGVKSIMFGGEGEPMLHKDINDIVTFAYTKLDVGFTTNGTCMNEEFLLKSLPCCTFIKISMNAGDASTYSKIHGCKPEHFEMVWNNIKSAVERKRALGIKTTIGVQCVLLPENQHTLPTLAKRCADIGVDYLVIKPYSHQSKSLHQENLQGINRDYIDQAMKFVTSTFEITARLKTMEAYDSDIRGYSKCWATPFLWAYIMATGDVYACSSYLLDERFNLGNINNQSFSAIWMGEKRKALIEEMEDFDASTCRKCCRMDKVNRYLEDVMNPPPHVNFI